MQYFFWLWNNEWISEGKIGHLLFKCTFKMCVCVYIYIYLHVYSLTQFIILCRVEKGVCLNQCKWQLWPLSRKNSFDNNLTNCILVMVWKFWSPFYSNLHVLVLLICIKEEEEKKYVSQCMFINLFNIPCNNKNLLYL